MAWTWDNMVTEPESSLQDESKWEKISSVETLHLYFEEKICLICLNMGSTF